MIIKEKKKKILFYFALFSIFLFFYSLWANIIRPIEPIPYQKQAIDTYIEKMDKMELEPKDYQFLLLQTGLGKPAIDSLAKEGKGNLILEYQKNFFEPRKQRREKIGPITYEMSLCDKNGKEIKGFEIASIQEGDIFITSSTSSFGWEHGHAAIVIDLEKQETLEAMTLGENTARQSIEKWRNYPQFVQLRITDTEEETGERIKKIAEKYLSNLPYRLLAGFPQKAVSPEKLKGTQCAHLVWYAYYLLGFDLDSDGGWLVTPKDITNSSQLEIVQVYGVNPENPWS